MQTPELALEVDALVVETSLERDATQRLEPIVRAALVELAQALRRLPGAQLERLDALVLDHLDLDLDLDDPGALLGPAGPARLADQLLERLLARTGELR